MGNVVYWLGALLLFICGVVWAPLLPGIEMWLLNNNIRVVDVFSVLSAIATASAAIAAWKAAQINKGQWMAAREQANNSAQQNRLQFYMHHWAIFNEWLDGIQKDVGVVFYRRAELYDVMFPSNRDVQKPFSSIGDGEIAAWHRSLEALVSIACQPSVPAMRAIADWMGDYCGLADHMRYSLPLDEDVQVWLGDNVPSGINHGNFKKVLQVMSEVLDRLSRFANLDSLYMYRGMTSEFEQAVTWFINEVQSKQFKGHTYR